jgi:hypothetical protein
MKIKGKEEDMLIRFLTLKICTLLKKFQNNQNFIRHRMFFGRKIYYMILINEIKSFCFIN